MIVVDASILVGLLKDEADVMMLEPLVIGPARCIIGAPTLVEASLWALTNGRQRSDYLEAWASSSHVTVHPFDHAMAQLARDAFGRFGRPSGHPARLKFGDALTYAVAMTLGLPLLYKGGEFGGTDVISHPASIRL